MDNTLEQAGSNAVTCGLTILAPQRLLFRRPIDVVKAPARGERSSQHGVRIFTRSIRNRPFVTFQGHRSQFRSMRCSLPSENSIGELMTDDALAACLIDFPSR